MGAEEAAGEDETGGVVPLDEAGADEPPAPGRVVLDTNVDVLNQSGVKYPRSGYKALRKVKNQSSVRTLKKLVRFCQRT